MTNWLAPIDIYCERLDASWWSEPINALTNLTFVLAGLLIMRRQQPPAKLLGALVAVIGIGSFLFHTHANQLTGFIDVFFIGVYLATYAWLWPKWVWCKDRFSQSLSVGILLTLIVGASLANQIIAAYWPNVPPGAYTGAWFYVMGLATLSRGTQPQAATWLWTAAGLFFCALVARQLDMPLCEQTGGTHWLWHTFNAGVLYASARALLTGSAPGRFARSKTDVTN